ncbi:hypothetical protein T07_5696 [Trichinella nelsoni]|uniref:Uncharacterized protein n=1 Tax=Trichinella nelsoni TaxID=6336 RepID=A0A0V0RYM4_9BILA|nr:hypothetical protein T07_5696 [Trichinella nelsoni]
MWSNNVNQITLLCDLVKGPVARDDLDRQLTFIHIVKEYFATEMKVVQTVSQFIFLSLLNLNHLATALINNKHADNFLKLKMFPIKK